MRQEAQDFADQAIRGAPAIAGAAWYGMTLNEWVAVATGIYIVVQLIYLLRKWYREESELVKRNKKRDRRASDRGRTE